MLYNTLWYFPVLMVVGGITTIVWDYRWPQQVIKKLKPIRRTEQTPPPDVEAHDNTTEMSDTSTAHIRERRSQTSLSPSSENTNTALRDPSAGAQINRNENDSVSREDEHERTVPEALKMRVFSWKSGTSIIALFFVTFIAIMVLRGVLPNRPRGFSLFANLYLAGTIIFGGGPVVIPLLRESVFNMHDALGIKDESLTKPCIPGTWLQKAGSLHVTSSSVSPSSKPFRVQTSIVSFCRLILMCLYSSSHSSPYNQATDVCTPQSLSTLAPWRCNPLPFPPLPVLSLPTSLSSRPA